MRLLALTLLLLAFVSSVRAELITPKEALVYLRRYEGVSTVVYRDPGGGYSVGVGHWLGHAKPAKTTYTQTEVLALFYRDLAVHLESCISGVRDFAGLPKPVQLTTLGLCWTVGPTGFQRFTNLRRALSFRAYQSAAAELVDSRWWNQVGRTRRMDSYNTFANQP